MKTLFLVAGGRGGSDFFQGLLDGHSQILSFPLYLRIDKKFIEMIELNDSKKLAKQFIKLFPEFFNSKINIFERHHRLGKKKNKFFTVDKIKFINNFIRISKSSKLSKSDKIKFLHYAYAEAKGENIKKKKILFIHTHLVSWTKEFFSEIKPKNTEIIHIIRHPLASLSSPIKNWLNYDDGKSFFPKDLYFQLDLVFKGISDLTKFTKVRIIKYESLNWKNKKILKNFCKIYNIKYEKSLETCTKNGLLWWGDSVSKKWLTGINKNFKIQIDKSYFFQRDLSFFQFINSKVIKNYHYKSLFKEKKIYFNFLPMKCELLVWRNTIKHLIYSFRWKQFISIPFYYLLRIILINKFMESNKLPYFIGSKK